MPAVDAAPDVLAAPAEQGPPGGVVITLPCGPVPVTVRWGDGSVTTVQPAPPRASRETPARPAAGTPGPDRAGLARAE